MAGFGRRVQKRILKKKKERKTDYDSAKMDDANRAMCYALRNPPRGSKQKPMKYKDIRLHFARKTNGRKPTIQSIAEAAATWKDEKGERGRPAGSNKTTKLEDKKIMQKFHKLRPPGHAIDSRALHKALPENLRKKIGRRTIIRCLVVSTISEFGSRCNCKF